MDNSHDSNEPVAVYVGETWCGSVVRLYDDLPLETPLYTRPQAREPLTDEELEKVFPAIATYHPANKTLYRSIARAIEAAHGIKGEK